MSRLATLFLAAAVLTGGAMLAAPAFAVGNEDDPLETASNPDYDNAVRAVKRENYRDAIGYLTRVLSDDPKNADALNYMGFSHRKLGDFKNAIAFYTDALSVDPDHRGANEYLGEAYLEINDLPNAETRLAHLRTICDSDCDEFFVLSAAVRAYKSGHKPSQSSRRRW
jgi:tetratricopeptide (TPR) repeat protein